MKPDEVSRRRSDDEITADCYEGVDLAPHTVASLATWDVSELARRERARLLAAYRAGRDIQRRY